MATVQGILGPIDTADLGFTLMHEHIFIANSSMRLAFNDWVDVGRATEVASEEATAARKCGVKTLVDLTPINLGRDIHIMREVAERAEIQVIAATGLYYHEEPWMNGWEVDRIVEFLIQDIEKGIQGTDSKAGIIKCATDAAGITTVNEKLLRVAARLQRATGVPISTHTDAAAEVGPGQQDVFEDEGVDLSRVVIGHCGDSNDLDYLERVLRRGSTIGMDRFGIDMINSTDQRVATIVELGKRGYANQMVLSHDACCHMDFWPQDMIQQIMKPTVPNWNFRHIPDDVVPALRKQGMSEADLTAMVSDNPRSIFEKQGAY
ncbi:MAG: phosphotriesterase [bacterium]|nr:phosphotriesterase [bacterium]